MPADPNQISVPLPPELRAFVERRAAAEERSIAYVVRKLIAKAALRERQAAASEK